MQQTPVSQMQQLVSHWSTLMKPQTNSKKRGRGDDDEHVNSKTRNVNMTALPTETGPAKSEMTRGPEPFAWSFS